jgi:hypothetical protein
MKPIKVENEYGDLKIINAEEIALIHQAVKQHGGIVPNWSSQP